MLSMSMFEIANLRLRASGEWMPRSWIGLAWRETCSIQLTGLGAEFREACLGARFNR